MRALALLALLAIGCASKVEPPAAPSALSSGGGVHDWMIPHTALVTISCGGFRSGGGSAVFLGGDQALTAAHVVDEAEGCDVVLSNAYYKVKAVKVVFPQDGSDLALLTLNAKIPLGSIQLTQGALGEPVVVVGYPTRISDDEQALHVTAGVIASLGYADNQDRITAQVYFGNSGGPVYNSAGELVGIAVGLYAVRVGDSVVPYDGLATMVPYRYMADLVRSTKP